MQKKIKTTNSEKVTIAPAVRSMIERSIRRKLRKRDGLSYRETQHYRLTRIICSDTTATEQISEIPFVKEHEMEAKFILDLIFELSDKKLILPPLSNK